jgi:hypothetical protein
MSVGIIGVFIPIIISLGLFAMIFGIVYLRSREKMAMIERGMDPRNPDTLPRNTSVTLTSALLLIGSGFGLFLAYLLEVTVFPDGYDATAIYFALIALFGGLGLFAAHLIERKEFKENKGQ